MVAQYLSRHRLNNRLVHLQTFLDYVHYILGDWNVAQINLSHRCSSSLEKLKLKFRCLEHTIAAEKNPRPVLHLHFSIALQSLQGILRRGHLRMVSKSGDAVSTGGC